MKKWLIACAAFLSTTLMLAQRNETLLKNWKFSHSDNEMQANENFNDK